MHTEAINHDPAITFFQTGAQLAGPAEHRRVAHLRPGQREPRPAGVRRADLAGHRQPDDQPLYDRLWGSGFLPSQYQGVKFRSGGDPVLYLSNPAGRRRRDAPAHARRPRPSSTSCSSTRSATRRSPRASRSTSWPSACRPSVPELTDISQRAAARPRPVRPRRRASPARTPPTACWPGGWPSAACASSSSSIAAGTSTTNLPQQIAGQCRDTDQPSRGADHRPEAARPARRHAGRLGRRVRPHGLLPGHADGRRTTAATIIRAASPIWLAGGGIKPGMTLRRDRRLLLQHRREPGPRPRPARHDPALPGHRPHAADVQVPGPRLPADRRARQGGEGDFAMTVVKKIGLHGTCEFYTRSPLSPPGGHMANKVWPCRRDRNAL